MAKPSLNPRCVANQYAGPNERIVEFSSPNGGGLISLREAEDGRLLVELFRLDASVDVRLPTRPIPGGRWE